MSITATTTRISHRWLKRKTKRELASIIMANIYHIAIFAGQNHAECERLRGELQAVYRQLIAAEADIHWLETHICRRPSGTEVPLIAGGALMTLVNAVDPKPGIGLRQAIARLRDVK